MENIYFIEIGILLETGKVENDKELVRCHGKENQKAKQKGKKKTKQTTDLFIFIPRECFRGEDKPEIFRSTFHETDIVESQPAPAYDLKERREKIMNVKYCG